MSLPVSSSLPASSFPAPAAGSFPAPRGVPGFPPVRVGRGRFRLRRAGPAHRRLLAGCLVPAVAVLVGLAPGTAERERAQPPDPEGRDRATASERPSKPVELRSAPVRIADAATVRLLRPGDRVDVVAARESGSHLIAAGARVTQVPKPGAGETAGREGALVVLSVPRATAVRLAGAGETARLAVALC